MDTLPPALETPPAPILPTATPLDRKWHEIWLDVWMHPGDQVFRDILKERDHGAGRAFIWIAVTSLILGLISAIGYIPVFQSNLVDFGLSNSSVISTSSVLIAGLCSLIFAPIAAIIGISISTGIYHLVSKLFHGYGSWSDLLFCMAAVAAPSSLISTVLFIPYLLFRNFPAIFVLVALLIGIISVVLAVYVLIMNVNAIRVAENLGTGSAIGTLLVPIAIGVVLGFCCLSLTVPALVNSIR
jgi:hypothetical protein